MQNPPTRAFFNAFTEEFLKRTDGEDMDPFFFLAVVNSLGRLEKRPSKLIRGIEMEIVRRVDELPVLVRATSKRIQGRRSVRNVSGPLSLCLLSSAWRCPSDGGARP